MSSEVKRGQLRLRRRTIGLMLTLFGSTFALFTFLLNLNQYASLGISVTLIGVLAALIPESEAVRTELISGVAASSLRNTQNLLTEFEVQGKGIYIPASGIGKIPKVFVAMPPNYEKLTPPLDLIESSRVLVSVPGSSEVRGVLLAPSGGELFKRMEEELAVDFSEIASENLERTLKDSLDSFDLPANLYISLTSEGFTVNIDTASFAQMEKRLLEEYPDAARRIGSPLASIVACALAKSSGRHLLLDSITLEGDALIMTLKSTA